MPTRNRGGPDSCLCVLQPITTGGVTYREQPWHKECFVCTACKKQLSGQRFTARDEFPYCLTCFCDLYAKKCAGCTNPISGKHPGKAAARGWAGGGAPRRPRVLARVLLASRGSAPSLPSCLPAACLWHIACRLWRTSPCLVMENH